MNCDYYLCEKRGKTPICNDKRYRFCNYYKLDKAGQEPTKLENDVLDNFLKEWRKTEQGRRAL